MPKTLAPKHKRAAAPSDRGERAGIASSAVERRTGKGWDEWFALLDGLGAADLDHKTIAARLEAEHAVDGWWAQMITVAYEQARGRRVKHQRSDGFGISATRTMPVSRAELWKSIVDAKRRVRWFITPKWEVRSQKAPERIAVTWKDGTIVEFHLYEKGADRSQIAIDHRKLPGAKEAAAMKACWRHALDLLGRRLQTELRAGR